MKKYSIIIVVAILLLLIGGVSIRAWVVSAPTEVAPSISHIEVLKGQAELKTSTSDVPQTITGTSTEVNVGDRVRATSGSVVEIVWGDTGVTRLENGSELLIESLPADDKALIVNVQSGSIWNRLIKVLDIDTPTQVKAGDVVATVRGTTFGVGIENGTPSIVVDESVVAVESGVVDQLIADKQRLRFTASGTEMVTAIDDAWLKEQSEKDLQFDQRYSEWLLKREGQRVGKTKSVSKRLLSLGERMRLATAGTKKQELASQFARRALAKAIIDPQAADDVMEQMVERAKHGDQKRIQKELHLINSFFARNEQDRALERGLKTLSPSVRKNMRHKRLAMADLGLAQLYREALDIDEDIDQLFYIADQRRDASITVASLLARIDALEIKAKALTDQELLKLSKKTIAMRRRLERWFEMHTTQPVIETLQEPVTTTSTTSTIPINPIPQKPVSGSIIKPPTTATTTTPAPVTRIYQRIELVPSPSSIAVEGQSVIKAFGIRADGGVADITSSVRFSLVSGSLGALQGNIFTGKLQGNAAIDGTYVDPQGSRTARATVIITDTSTPIDPAALQSVSVVTTSPTSLSCNTTAPIKVMGTYGDGTKKDVTVMALYSTSDAKLGYASEGMVTVFCPALESRVTITARVTEKGITKSGSITFTIVPDPQSNTTTPKGRGTFNPILY